MLRGLMLRFTYEKNLVFYVFKIFVETFVHNEITGGAVTNLILEFSTTRNHP